jgi:hypothetical protein
MHSISEEARKKDLAIIQKLRLMDDDLMVMVFDGNNEVTELLLHTILQRSDIVVEKIEVQKEYRSVAERTIKLDIFARDANGKVYDIEVQRANSGAVPQRARFHSSMLDTRLLGKNEDFSELPESYVIFITEHDVMGAGCALYHVERHIEELQYNNFNDGAHIIYVNGSYHNDDDPIGRLMHDFRCVDPADMYYAPLARRMQYFKDDEGGKENMCKLIEDRVYQERLEAKAEGKAEGRAEGRAEGKAEGIEIGVTKGEIKTICAMIQTLGISVEQALDAARIPENEKESYRKAVAEATTN